MRRHSTFEDYLDSLVIDDDQRFLKDVDTARRLAQLGYRCPVILPSFPLGQRSSGKTLSEPEFRALKEQIAFRATKSFEKTEDEVGGNVP